MRQAQVGWDGDNKGTKINVCHLINASFCPAIIYLYYCKRRSQFWVIISLLAAVFVTVIVLSASFSLWSASICDDPIVFYCFI